MNPSAVMIGREREHARLADALGGAGSGRRVVVLRGPVGVGTTSLLRSALGEAADRGSCVRSVHSRSILSAFPQLLDHVQHTDADVLGAALVREVAQLAHERPVVIAVDDACGLDATSVALLPYLLTVDPSVDITVVLVQHTDGPAGARSLERVIDAAAARSAVTCVDVAPLDDASMRRLIASAFDSDDAADAPDWIVERAAGIPWFALELVAEVRAGGGGVPESIAALTADRLDTLDDGAHEVALSIALNPSGAHLNWLEVLAGRHDATCGHVLGRILDTGLFRATGELVHVAHPLVRDAMLARIAPVRARELHRGIIRALAASQLERAHVERLIAFHLAESGQRLDAVDRYLRAADIATTGGQHHDAQRDLRAALELEDRFEERIPLLRRVALALVHAGELDSADLWAQLVEAATAEADADLLAFTLVYQYIASDGSDVAALERAASMSPEASGWAAFAGGLVADFGGDLEGARDALRGAVQRAVDAGDELLLASTQLALAAVLVDLGAVEESLETVRCALRSFQSQRMYGKAVTAWYSMISTLTEQAETSLALAEAIALDRYVGGLGLDRFRPLTLSCLAMCHATRGDLPRALELIADATARSEQLADNPYFGALSATYVQMTDASIRGRVGARDAYASAQLALRVAEDLDQHSWVLEARRELLLARARRQGIESVLDELADLESITNAEYVSKTVHWLARQSVLTSNAAGLARVRELRANADAWTGTAVSHLIRDEVDALLAAVDGADIAAVTDLAGHWAKAGCGLDARVTTACAGAILAARGESDDALVLLKHARAELATAGASGDSDVVAAILRSLGTRSRSRTSAGAVGPLTTREAEIARLVADGLRNKEVAAALHIGERTIAVHLNKIYRKLDIHSRVELTRWMAQHDADSAMAV